MDAKAFRRNVTSHRPLDTSIPASEGLELALRFFEEHHFTDLPEHQSVPACIQLAALFDQQLALQPGTHEEGDARRALTGDLSAESLDRVQHILPQVTEVRQELFGISQVPFVSDADAATWIEREGTKQDVAIAFDARGGKEWIDQRPQSLKQQLSMLWQGIHAGSQEYLRISGETAPPFQPQRPRLPYMRPSLQHDGTEVLLAEEFPVCPGSPLARLAEVSSALAQATGFTQLDVVRHLLLGTQPTLPLYRVHIRQEPGTLENLENVSAGIEVFTSYLSDIQLRDIRRYLHHYMESERLKRLKQEDAQLLRLVVEHGEVPQGQGSGAGAYWENIRQAWNRTEADKQKAAQQAGYKYKPQYAANTARLLRRWERLQPRLRVPRQTQPAPPGVSIRSGVVGDAVAVERLRRLGTVGE